MLAILVCKKKKSASLQAIKQMDQLDQIFSLPLSVEAHGQLHAWLTRVENIANSDNFDIWSYIWGTTHYSASNAYRHLCGTRNVHPAFAWTWKASVQNKQVFFWLLLKDRPSTRGLLRRRNMHLNDYNCVLCTLSVKECRDYLFLEIWNALCFIRLESDSASRRSW